MFRGASSWNVDRRPSFIRVAEVQVSVTANLDSGQRGGLTGALWTLVVFWLQTTTSLCASQTTGKGYFEGSFLRPGS